MANEENKAPEQTEENQMAGQEDITDRSQYRYDFVMEVRVKLKSGYVLRKVGQAYMVMPTGPRMKNYQGMITLNETGAFLFKEMEKPDMTKEKLVEASKAEYGATDEEAQKAVSSFIEQCGKCGLFETREMVLDKQEGTLTPRDEFEEKWAKEHPEETEETTKES